MGGAIARGLAKGTIIKAEDICVSNPSQGKLDALKAEFPAMQVTHSNVEAVQNADIVLLAVKPWFIEPVIKELPLDVEKQILISLQLERRFPHEKTVSCHCADCCAARTVLTCPCRDCPA